MASWEQVGSVKGPKGDSAEDAVTHAELKGAIDGVRTAYNLIKNSWTLDNSWLLKGANSYVGENTAVRLGMKGKYCAASGSVAQGTDTLILHFPFQPNKTYFILWTEHCNARSGSKIAYRTSFPAGVVSEQVNSGGSAMSGNNILWEGEGGSPVERWVKITTTSTTSGWKDVSLAKLDAQSIDLQAVGDGKGSFGAYAPMLTAGNVYQDYELNPEDIYEACKALIAS